MRAERVRHRCSARCGHGHARAASRSVCGSSPFLMLAIPFAGYAADRYLQDRQAVIDVMTQFGDAFVREFERPLIESRDPARALRSRLRFRPHQGQVEVLLAPARARRYPNLVRPPEERGVRHRTRARRRCGIRRLSAARHTSAANGWSSRFNSRDVTTRGVPRERAASQPRRRRRKHSSFAEGVVSAGSAGRAEDRRRVRQAAQTRGHDHVPRYERIFVVGYPSRGTAADRSGNHQATGVAPRSDGGACRVAGVDQRGGGAAEPRTPP